MRIIRFVIVTVGTTIAITILGHLVSDFDVPDDPHDAIRGIGIWIIGLLVAALDARNTRRKRDGPPP